MHSRLQPPTPTSPSKSYLHLQREILLVSRSGLVQPFKGSWRRVPGPSPSFRCPSRPLSFLPPSPHTPHPLSKTPRDSVAIQSAGLKGYHTTLATSRDLASPSSPSGDTKAVIDVLQRPGTRQRLLSKLHTCIEIRIKVLFRCQKPIS